MLRTNPKLNVTLWMWSPINQTEGKKHFPSSAGYTVSTAQDPLLQGCIVYCWHVQFAAHQDAEICFSQVAFLSVLEYEVLQSFNLYFFAFELCMVLVGPFFQPVDVCPRPCPVRLLLQIWHWLWTCWRTRFASWTLHCLSHFLALGVSAKFPSAS